MKKESDGLSPSSEESGLGASECEVDKSAMNKRTASLHNILTSKEIAMRKLSSTFFLSLLVLLAACSSGPPGGSKPTIDAFSADPQAIESGEQSTLSWSVSGATSLELDPGNLDVTGKTSQSVSPTVTTPYTLTATNGSGSSERTTTVTVDVPALMPVVNPEVTPPQPTLPDGEGDPQPVAGSQDENGIQSDFIVGQVLVRPETEAELNDFLVRYEGTVISDNTIPEPPSSLGITLTPEQRQATEYLVRINLAKVDPEGFAADAAAVGMGGLLEFSSQDALLTLAGVTDALAAGFDVSPNYLSYPSQIFPTTLLRTDERPIGAGGFTNAFDTTRFQSTGSQSNVTLAWQFVMAHGVQERPIIAIIDEGFWLDTNGNPRGTDSDFPAIVGQYDFPANDYIADGPGTIGCGGAVNTCVWHGTGATGVAAGVINNRLGDAGTGGLIADVMLFKRGGTRGNGHRAVRTAVAWGADVVSMSYSGDCNQACRIYDRDNTPFDDAVAGGSRTVFLAAAGNGEDPDGDLNFTGYNTGDPRFVHPCIEDHVICVGALNDNATTKIGYSNFGRVSIFAPTNIPVMAQPAGTDSNPNGPAAPRSFGGTSASTPFVAGVAAMMKAINPALNSAQVNQILRDTAHKGAAPADFYLDAYAAVRRAAEGIEAVKDRLEPNGPTLPSQLGGAGPWNEANLNLHAAQDRDYYRFSSPQRSTLRVDVAYPEGLGAVPVLGLNGNEACGVPAQTLDMPLPGGGRRLEYTVASGPHTFSLGGGLVNAYNLGISFTPASALSPDFYEANNEPGTAKYLYSLKPRSTEFAQLSAIDPAVTIDANLHASSDVDYYQVRGVTTTLAQQVLLQGGPIVEVYGNESPVTLEVYLLNPDNTQGGLVGSASNQKCDGHSLAVAVESGKSYLVKVSGGAGRYSLFNGVRADPRKLPEWVRDRLYLILNPGDPIEHVVRNPLIYIFTGDRAFSEINVRGDLHLELFDFAGTLLAEGAASGQGFDETLGLEAVRLNNVYALQITPTEPTEAGTLMTLSWGATPASRTSDNLIRNPGAEEGPGNDSGGAVDFIEDWGVPSDFVEMPTVIYYNGVNDLPDQDDPGAENRGDRFFAGGPGTAIASVRQQSDAPDDWRLAIDGGTVKFNLSGFLGGFANQTDHATLSVTFIDGNFQELGKATLGPVTPGEREGETGLFPVATSNYVPPATQYLYIDLEFLRHEGDYNDGYADNLELTFSDFSP